ALRRRAPVPTRRSSDLNLAVRPGLAATLVTDGTAWLVNSAAVALFGLAAALGVTTWSVFVPPAAAGGLAAWLAVDGLVRWRTGRSEEHTSELQSRENLV